MADIRQAVLRAHMERKLPPELKNCILRTTTGRGRKKCTSISVVIPEKPSEAQKKALRQLMENGKPESEHIIRTSEGPAADRQNNREARQSFLGVLAARAGMLQSEKQIQAKEVQEAATIQQRVESLLDLRTKPLKTGQLKKVRRPFAREVEGILLDSVTPAEGKEAELYKQLAFSFSRLFALHYRSECDRQPDEVEPGLRKILPHLAEHLLAELQLCMKMKFPKPENNLCKLSAFDMQKKLDELLEHKDEAVKDYAKTILSAALTSGNIAIADKLAKGAQRKLEKLQKYKDEVVRDNAKTILNTALKDGNLAIADKLAEGAQRALNKLTKKGIKNARKTLSDMLNEGTLNIRAYLKRHTKKVTYA